MSPSGGLWCSPVTTNGTSVARPVPSPWREPAVTVFGERLELAEQYAELLATWGVQRGLIGPREEPRLWERHLLNCAVLGELIDTSTDVIDVGSGAGLPGLALAIARPDLSVTLVEPLLRRVRFLDEVISSLGLSDQVRVIRARAEDVAGKVSAPVVTARAVAPLERLLRWCLPLVSRKGYFLAMKGETAESEVRAASGALSGITGGSARIVTCGRGVVDPLVTVVEVPR